ncbi:hypothetical protein ABB37_03027 [Leptomonas pyrrhocoris]|uniref:Uncharacterized protein n=1 Tax=Leptomonas pyrrhocoris TaxID=157538 RepID=A0A0M9G6F5_LEPPY|nr:hypothetical protein ABB37_03027 [Leptomonas pyrrhocoris]KPA83383.1 hypothetical protein ABB37_03027 [Leptomonas pyrrhocoris]|eukprot:XP_015661822.1 hypothetical protein ABB37_03027 [Leptomonas pyrrhocoris]
MSPLSAKGLFWLSVTAVAVMLSLVVFATAKSCSGTVCTPYVAAVSGGTGCLRKNPINLRFVLQMAQENNYTVNGVLKSTATFAFTPCVDDIAALALNTAPFLAAGYAVTNNATPPVTSYYLTGNRSDKYLSVFGFGMSNQTTEPEVGVSTGAVLVAKNGLEACGDPTMVGVVTLLSLEIGLHKGYFNYVGQSGQTTTTIPNPNYNASMCGDESGSGGSRQTTTTTAPKANAAASSSDSIDYCSKTITVNVPAINVQPARVGFAPTCNAQDQCTLGDPDAYVCIGNVTGKKNCGLCYSNAATLAGNSSVTVWVSYVGTDRKNVVMTSSGDNPIYYSNFVRSGAFQTISSKFNSLIHGNFSVVGLNVNFAKK